MHKASCHCGVVQFEVTLRGGLRNPHRCSCSLCAKRGAVVASVELADLKITCGEDKLSLYQFNTRTARHYFCSICGIYTHHQRRSNPRQFSFNVACLEGVDPYAFGEVPVADGINHPCDRGG